MLGQTVFLIKEAKPITFTCVIDTANKLDSIAGSTGRLVASKARGLQLEKSIFRPKKTTTNLSNE